MQAAVLLLLGVSLYVVCGSEENFTPDLPSMVKELQTKVQALETSLPQQQTQQVAFFAAFNTDTEEGNHGPFDIATAIRYKKVLTNEGNGYNAATGAFTAPRRGLYVFHFSIFATYSPAPNVMAVLKKNGVSLAVAFDKASSDTHDSSTRVAVVTLEAGDAVYVELQARGTFYDYRGDHNSFSGFLLSPM